jgi:hypothetical protein
MGDINVQLFEGCRLGYKNRDMRSNASSTKWKLIIVKMKRFKSAIMAQVKEFSDALYHESFNDIDKGYDYYDVL